MTFSKVQEFVAGGDDDAVVGFRDAVDWGVGVDRCAVGLRGGDGRGDGTVGPQGAGMGVEDGDVVGAEVVLRVALGHLLAAEDLVVRLRSVRVVSSRLRMYGPSAVPMESPPQRVRMSGPVSASSSAQSRAGALQDGVVARGCRGRSCGTAGCRRRRRCGRGQESGLRIPRRSRYRREACQRAMLPMLPRPMTASFPSMVRAPARGRPGCGVLWGW